MMTFDFVFYFNRNNEFKREVENCISEKTNKVLCTDIHKMIFNGYTEMVKIEPLSENSPFYYKTIPAEIKYETLTELLNGNYDAE